MDDATKHIVWQQCAAALRMLEHAARACPDDLWHDPAEPRFAVLVWHCLDALDRYLERVVTDFPSPEPFTSLSAAPVPLTQVPTYGRDDLLLYLTHGRRKAGAALELVGTDHPQATLAFELLVYNTRHIQHHIGQLYLILRQRVGSVPPWIGK